MKIHIIGICGTFMGGIAMIARQQGHEVSGCDESVYPPMSDTLRDADITILEGYLPEHIPDDADVVIVGNTISRGNPALEYVLEKNLPYTSGPQWLADLALKGRHVLGVSGTHGKTTTSSILAWILEFAGLKPGYLIGGVAKNFDATARLGDSKFFVIEADEYDTAFFDKRSKFLHYRPQTLILNNLEFDHADIFEDLAAIQKQFSYLLRTVSPKGLVIRPADDQAIDQVVQQGCWTPVETFGVQRGDWTLLSKEGDGSEFEFEYLQKRYRVAWSMLGMHNVQNAIAAIAAAHFNGVTIEQSVAALSEFKGVKRRLEVCGEVNGITVYDDFAHHPTAIAKTLSGLRSRVGDQRIIAVLQFGSNTMSAGVHKNTIANSLEAADMVVMMQPNDQSWSLQSVADQLSGRAVISENVDDILENLTPQLKANDHVLIMSNKGFGGIHQRLLNELRQT